MQICRRWLPQPPRRLGRIQRPPCRLLGTSINHSEREIFIRYLTGKGLGLRFETLLIECTGEAPRGWFALYEK